MQVWFLALEDPLEKKMATLSSILSWKNPQTEEPGGVTQSWTWLSTHTILIPSISSQNYSSVGMLSSLQLQIQVVQNSNFHLKGCILTVAKNTLICFPWSDRSIFFVFEKMSAKYLSLNNYNLSVSCSSKWNGVAWRKWLVELTTQTHKCFARRPPLCFARQQKWKCFLHASSCITQNMKRCVFKSWDLIPLIISIALSMTFLRENALCTYLLVFVIQRARSCRAQRQLDAVASTPAKAPALPSTVAFVPSGKLSTWR